jgi:hypothetical protein
MMRMLTCCEIYFIESDLLLVGFEFGYTCHSGQSLDGMPLARKHQVNQLFFFPFDLHIIYKLMIKQLDTLAFSSWHLYVVTALGVAWVFDGLEVSMLPIISN